MRRPRSPGTTGNREPQFKERHPPWSLASFPTRHPLTLAVPDVTPHLHGAPVGARGAGRVWPQELPRPALALLRAAALRGPAWLARAGLGGRSDLPRPL